MQQAGSLPFTSAALRYREKFFTKQWTPGAAAVDLSPPGGQIKSYGYLRALSLQVSVVASGTGGNLAADAPWNLFSQLSVTQPNGEEMYGGPTFSGYHGLLAAQHSGWRYANDPKTMPSYTSSATDPTFILPIVFEMDAEKGVGALPNQDFSAPWKLQITGAASTAVYQTAPTTAPTLQLDVYMDCWTVPSPVNPLNPAITQEVAPPLLGTLNKWTIQQYIVPSSSFFDVLLQRKGNAIRNFTFVTRGAANARVSALTNFPNPFTIRWDGTVVRSNDAPLLVRDDEYHTRGGEAAATPTTAELGVLSLQMSDPAGLDTQGVGEMFGMNAFWGTVQSSTISIAGTWGSTVTLLEVLTNDVQFVDLAGNPYAFAYGGYLQAPAQAGARP